MSETYRAQLVHTLRKVLKPLVRILLRAGVRIDEFVDLLRGIYVEIIIHDAVTLNQSVTTGRISILSGVPKRDVERIVSAEDWLRIPKPTDAAALAAVLHRWHTDSMFLGPYGVPLELPMTGAGGRSFSDLVFGSATPIDVHSALEQLLNAGVVARSGETHVKVLSRSYVMPEPLSAEMLEHFGMTMTNLASTLDFNMRPDSREKRLEKSVFPDGGLPEELFKEFDAYVRERVNAMLSEVDDWLADAARRPLKNPALRTPTGVSVYHYVAAPEPRIVLDKHVVSTNSQG